MSAFIDLTGQRFWRWKVLKQSTLKKRWVCMCDCGTTRDVLGAELRSGGTKSCGCYAREVSAIANKTHGHSRRTKAYTTWLNMRKRCSENAAPRDKSVYYDRGIRVCERWMVFENFLQDMGEPPPGCSIDRIDGDKGYSPDNCRWATAKMQARNSKVTKLSDADVASIISDTRPYKDIARQFNISTGHVTKIRSGKFYPRTLEILSSQHSGVSTCELHQQNP